MSGEITVTKLARLQEDYSAARYTPLDVIKEVNWRIEASDDDHVWILRLSKEKMARRAAELGGRKAAAAKLPLYGVPFAVKDNIDVEGLPTTAGCPDFSYVAKRTAPVVQRLLDAGGILVGKTNLDQFATGLTGARSPYGVPKNPYDKAYIPGGSSSGSAVAVASGFVSFALGTDTAGSGRVPAGFNNVVGLKPTRGLLSISGIVPACRSLDCIAIFAMDTHCTAAVMDVAAAPDVTDGWRRNTEGAVSSPGHGINRTCGASAGNGRNHFGPPQIRHRTCPIKASGSRTRPRDFAHARSCPSRHSPVRCRDRPGAACAKVDLSPPCSDLI